MSVFRLEREGSVSELVDLLHNSDNPDIRHRVVETLATFDDNPDPAIDGLIHAAQHDENDKVRAKAIESLDELGEEAFERFIGVIADIDTNQGVNEWIMGDPSTQALAAPDPELRMAAATVLGRVGDESVLPMLIERLSDDDPRVRACVAKACGRLGDDDAVEELTSLITDSHPQVRQEVAVAFGHIESDTAVSGLLELLSDDQARVRRVAVEELGSNHSHEVIDKVVPSLLDPKDGVRRAAVYSVLQILSNTPPEDAHVVRETIEEAIDDGDVDDRVVFDAIIEIIEAGNESSHRRNAIWLLNLISGESPSNRVIDVLVEALSDDDSIVSHIAASQLMNYDSDYTENKLLDLLDAPNTPASVHGFTLFVLGKIGGKRSQNRIQAFVSNSSDGSLKQQAHAALSRLKAHEAMAVTSG